MVKLNHIKQVGVELEGAFEPKTDPNAPPSWPNGGIKCEGMTLTPQESDAVAAQHLIVGERNSKPYDNLNHLRSWVADFFPKIRNRSNGFHIHVSFKNDELRKKLIASKEFHAEFLAAAKEFVGNPKYKFNNDMKERVIKGSNGYARHDFNPESRTAVHAFSHHNTCEFRLFSGSMELKQAKLVLTWLVTFVENYIDEHFMAEAFKDVGVYYKSYTGQAM
jgi:hypothetical protein